jgi:Ca2+-binding EF-hand superfamily protein
MSPTRDILCGDHRKLTQLPSLPMAERTSRAKLSKPHKHPSPPRGGSSLSKAATKKMMGIGNQESPGRRRHLSIFDHDQDTVDPMATSYGFLSPFAVERRRVSQQQQQQQRLKQQPTEHREQDHDEDSRENDVHNQPDPAIVRQFEQSERGILAQVFNWMDVDGSGTVDRKEMTWALAHDHEVLTLAKQSALLRLLLKQHSELDDLFSQLDVVNGKKQGEKSVPMRPAELSWDLFVVFCREMYVRLTEKGLLPSQEASHDPENSVNDKPNASSELPQRDKPVDTSEEEEERTIRRVFQLLDADGNGLLERREICAALYESVTRDERNGDDQAGNPELASLISASRALQPLLHESLFMKAFTSFESADPDGISEEEFVAFCLEIAEVAAANHFS